MLSAINKLNATMGRISSTPAAASLANRFTGTRLLQGLRLFNTQPAVLQTRTQSRLHMQASQRNIVTKAVLGQLDKTVMAKSILANFKFQEQNSAISNAVSNISTLQTRVISEQSQNSSAQSNITTKDNPAAHDIESLLQMHGPVRLTLYGLLPKAEGGGTNPTEHTVLVTGTFRDEHGTCYAVVVDGNHLARNPVKSFAETYATQYGKALHELDHHDHHSINQQLAKNGDDAVFGQAMYRLVNLDRAFENHHATITRHQNFLNTLQLDCEKDGHEISSECFQARTSEVAYDQHSRIDGTIPDDVTHALVAQIKSDPEAVEPFIPLQGQAATTDLFTQVPAVEKVFNAPSMAGQWKPVENVAELKNVLQQEATFSAALDKPENQQWLNLLFNEINAQQLPAGHKGVELMMHFPVAYGMIAHLAIGSMWRDQEGKLQMGIHHQEAVPIKGSVWEGHIYSTFDVTSNYPTGPVAHSAVEQSIKLTGMPNMKAVPTRYPEKIVALVEAMSGTDNAYPYGGTPRWHGDKGRFPEDKPFTSCSNTSLEAHKIMQGEYPVHDATLSLWKGELGTLYNIDYEKIKLTMIGGKEYSADTIGEQPFEIAGAIWAGVTPNSGSLPWPVPATHDTIRGKMSLPIGEGHPLPLDAFPKTYHGAVFMNPNGITTADGKPVLRNVFYTPLQIEAMTYTVEQRMKQISFVASVDRKAE
jgi:hypothetical protein